MDLRKKLPKLKKRRTEIPKSKVKSAKKLTSGFTMVLIPNSTEQSKTIEISFDQLMKSIASAVAIVIIMVALIISMAINNHTLKYGDENTRNTILSLQEENRELTNQVNELSISLQSSEAVLNKIEEQLSKDADVQAQQAEADSVPTELPVKGGTAILLQDPTIDVENGEKPDGIVFNALEGAVVVATASGSVISVDSDPNYGNKIVIDHGNGYITTYRTNALIKVSFGDTVRKNDMIAILTEEEGRVEYEITLDGKLIDPRDMIET